VLRSDSGVEVGWLVELEAELAAEVDSVVAVLVL
jgi:hypothetical protein